MHRRGDHADIRFEVVGSGKPTHRMPRRLAPMLLGLLLGVILREILSSLNPVLQQRWRTSGASPARLSVRGKEIFAPGRAEPVVLRGFDLMFKYGAVEMNRVTRQDRILQDLVPGVSLVRLIVNHWDDDSTSKAGTDCYDPSAVDYLRPACLIMFDEVINWATSELGSWAIITARSALAAGDGVTTIFGNATLRMHWVTMWAALARRYATVDRIAGFEIMSEPRSDASAEVIHAAQQQACSAIWAHDQGALCVVGPARFYDRFHFNKSLIVTGGPALYAANLFAPRSWVSTQIDPRMPNASYPGYFPCCDAFQKDRERRRSVCGGVDAHACASAPLVWVDQLWLQDQLRTVLQFRDHANVPVWLDQWGVRADAVGGNSSHEAYLRDALDLFHRERLHWTYWIWRRTFQPPSWTCDGFAVACQSSHGSYFINEQLLHHLGIAVAKAGAPLGEQKNAPSNYTPHTLTQTSHVDIGASPLSRLSPDLYAAMFFEEINFGGEARCARVPRHAHLPQCFARYMEQAPRPLLTPAALPLTLMPPPPPPPTSLGLQAAAFTSPAPSMVDSQPSLPHRTQTPPLALLMFVRRVGYMQSSYATGILRRSGAAAS